MGIFEHDREEKLAFGLLAASVACLALAVGIYTGPIQDERPVFFLREKSERREESQIQLKAGDFKACQALCEKEALCVAVTHDPGLDADCVLRLLGPTRQKRTWFKAGSRSQVAALVFGFLAAVGLVSSFVAIAHVTDTVIAK